MVKNLSIVADKGFKLNKKIVHEIVADLKIKLQFNIDSLQINFVNTDFIFSINKKYLNHYRTTDIITFNYSKSHELLEGEIFISYQDALENARKFNVNWDCELIRLIIHGFLHMLGYDDKNHSDKKIMKQREDELTILFCNKFRTLEIVYDNKNS